MCKEMMNLELVHDLIAFVYYHIDHLMTSSVLPFIPRHRAMLHLMVDGMMKAFKVCNDIKH